MKHQKLKPSKHGLSLVEIMIALGILGFVILLLTRVTNFSNVVTQRFNRDTDVTYLVGEVTQHLSSPYNCIETFKNEATGEQSFKPTSIVRRVNVDRTTTPPTISVPTTGRTLYISGNSKAIPYGPSKIQIGSYELRGIGAGSDSFLEIKIKGGGVTGPEILRKIALVTEWKGDVLVSCRSLSQGTTELWSRGVGRDIYYMGPVGIGTSEPGKVLPSVAGITDKSNYTVALEIAGDMLVRRREDGSGGDVTAKAFYYSSDLKLKKKVKPIRDAMASVSKLRGVEFDWRDSGEHDFGFIAQEIQNVIPEIVHKTPDDQLSVDYVKVIPFLVEAIKGQQQEIKELQDEVSKLEK
jgi:hypothetical protein